MDNGIFTELESPKLTSLHMRYAAFYGITLFLAALVAPALLNVKSLGIIDLIWQSLELKSATPLLDAGVRLVLMNTVRIVPTYLGVLVLTDILVRAGVARKQATWMYFLIPVVLVPLIYYMIQVVYGITYDFRMPAFLSIAAVVVTLRLSGASHSKFKTALIVTQLVFGFQWLDIVPALTGIGFGHGEVSTDIKLVAEVLDAESLLNTMGILLSSILVLSGLITSKFMVDYQAHLRLIEADRARKVELARMRAEATKSRTHREMQALVHDLRTPLTIIQGLSTVFTETLSDSTARSHAHRISEAAERMNLMIAQLLNGDARSIMKASEFVTRFRAHLSSEKTHGAVYVLEEENLPVISINEVRLGRAISNLMDNSLDSLRSIRDGRVEIVFARQGSDLTITVSDNGEGMDRETLSKCLDVGYSTRESTGLGLPFVKHIVEEHGGHLEVTSELGVGTVCKIVIPGCDSHGHQAQYPCHR